MLHRADDPAVLLPLSVSAFQILLVLAGGERHGYRITKEVGASNGGNIRLGSGTLYRLLRQMCTDGWISEIEHGSDDAMRRRYYRLMPKGRSIAEAEARRLEALVSLARARHLLPVPA